MKHFTRSASMLGVLALALAASHPAEARTRDKMSVSSTQPEAAPPLAVAPVVATHDASMALATRPLDSIGARAVSLLESPAVPVRSVNTEECNVAVLERTGTSANLWMSKLRIESSPEVLSRVVAYGDRGARALDLPKPKEKFNRHYAGWSGKGRLAHEAVAGATSTTTLMRV